MSDQELATAKAELQEVGRAIQTAWDQELEGIKRCEAGYVARGAEHPENCWRCESHRKVLGILF